jgi:hypothetical protein
MFAPDLLGLCSSGLRLLENGVEWLVAASKDYLDEQLHAELADAVDSLSGVESTSLEQYPGMLCERSGRGKPRCYCYRCARALFLSACVFLSLSLSLSESISMSPFVSPFVSVLRSVVTSL